MAGPIDTSVFETDAGSGPIGIESRVKQLSGSGGAVSEWTEINLVSATKLDPGTIENGGPVLQPDNYYEVAFDGSVLKTSTSDMLAYYVEVPDITFADSFSAQIVVAAKAESSPKLVAAAYISNKVSDLATGNGFWVGLSEESSDNPDSWIRRMNTAVPSVGGFASDDAVGLMTYEHTSTQDRTILTTYDLNLGAPTWKQFIGQQTTATISSSGSVYIGVLIGVRGVPQTAAETLQIKAQYRITNFPTF